MNDSWGDSQPAIGNLILQSDVRRYGPWIPRQGNSLLAAWEVIDITGGARPKLIVETKNTQDADSAAVDLGQLETATSIGAFSFVVTGCRELVRFSYLIDGATTDWVHLRDMPLVWVTN